MAEQQIEIYASVMPEQAFGIEHGLRFDLELARRHLDVLVLEGAKLCFPASVIKAKQQQYRINRELQGGLDFDAANNIIIQRQWLALLERKLDYVKKENVCQLPIINANKEPTNDKKQISELLNSDNQFAVNSSEINPKYVVRLAKATKKLNNSLNYNILITGHADTIGDKKHNLELSLKRATEVSRYLEILGLDSKRIKVSAVGSKQPLFNLDNELAQNRLVNRRVSIEIIEKYTSTLNKVNK